MELPRPTGDAHLVAGGQPGIVARPQVDHDPAGGVLEVDVPAVQPGRQRHRAGHGDRACCYLAGE